MESIVTLIVPVYNAEGTILRCIKSIQSQFFSNFEVILVDDGSDDDSLNLCKRLTKDDSRFVVLHQSNQGASTARNTGIDNAHGDYICFMDADDEIEKNYISELLEDAERADLVVHGMNQYVGSKHYDKGMHIDELFDLKHDYSSFFYKVNVDDFGGPVSKLFKRSIIENYHLRFDSKLRLAEDLDFFMRYLLHCTTVRTAPKNNYKYIMEGISASTIVYPFEIEFSGMLALDKAWTMLIKRFPCNNLKIRYERSLSAYVARLIPSIYQDNASSEVRLFRYRLIEPRFKNAYKKWYAPETAFMAFRKICFCNGYYNLLDCFLKFRLYR